MKVVHILTELEPFSQTRGGAISRWVGSVLPGSRFQSVVISPEIDGTWNGIAQMGWLPLKVFRKVQAVFCAKSMWPVRVLVLMLGFRNLKSKGIIEKKSVVYIQNRPEYVAAFRLLDFFWRSDIKIILHLHNDHLSSCASATRNMAITMSDRLVFCSKYLLENADLPHIAKSKGHVVLNGADPALFFPLVDKNSISQTSYYSICFVGRLVPEKGAHLLIQAVNMLIEGGIDVRLRIIGEPGFGKKTDGYSDYLKGMCPQIKESITFVGYKCGSELAKEFREATIFCCPSIWNEPFGMINIEAMASAVPVVASSVGGIPEILLHGSGVLVPSGDVEKLAQAIRALLENKSVRTEIAAKGYNHFLENYTWDKITAQYDSVIASLQ